jgi:N-methylhydantoinase A
MGYRVGVDIGGTFTDFCVFDEESGALATLKVLSRPDQPGAEVTTGLAELAERHGIAPAEVAYFTHGTTVGVNTVIQRKGVALCLFTTENFEDVLELARLKMPDPYDLFSARPEPLVTREKVFGLTERVLVDGSVDVPLDVDSVRRAIAGARAVGGEAVVVALLHAYRNPEHERFAAEIIRAEAPELDVILASEVWPVIREYERTVTATVAGYVQPRVAHYLGSLQDALKGAGVTAEAMITKSNGGVMTAELGKANCAQMLLSGTASGVIGAASVARQTGAPMAMSLDVGGTSADVAIIVAGEPQYGVGEMIGEFPIYIPTVSVTSIGEGGGSIAWVDDHGVLKVGPESAGSSPGPACYGKGGTRPTITDALVVLGFLGRSALGYSAVQMHPDLAHAAIGMIAEKMSMTPEAAAEAVVRVAVSGMYLEVSKLVSRHGIDPRELSLIAFGGAGPMLACWLARELGMREVVVPRVPGVLSAFGGLIADIKNDFIQTVYLDLDAASVEPLRDGFGVLARKAMRWIREDQGFEEDVAMIPSADIRYRGQSYEIDTPLEAIWIEEGDIEAIAGAFHRLHEQVYEHADTDAEVQIINLRLIVTGQPPKPAFAPAPKATGPLLPLEQVEVFHDGQTHMADVHARAGMAAGHCFEGPAIITQDDCTTCVLAGFSGRVDDAGNVILTRKAPDLIFERKD